MLQKEIWHQFIMEKFYASNPHLKLSTDVTSMVIDGKIVHIPQAGAGAGGEKNRTQFPAGVVTRGDTEVTYALDAYTSNPVRIPNIDQYELSYDKKNSVLGDTRGEMTEFIGSDILYKWASGLPATSTIRTSGADIDATVAGATGTRKALIRADLKKAFVKLANDTKGQIIGGNLVALVPVTMLGELVDPDKATYLTDEERRSGIVAKLEGFSIIPMTTRIIADASGAIKPVGSLATADDNDVVVCYDPSKVEHALGSLDMFSREKDPQFYADLFSFEQRYGGRRRRQDNIGVINIIQKS